VTSQRLSSKHVKENKFGPSALEVILYSAASDACTCILVTWPYHFTQQLAIATRLAKLLATAVFVGFQLIVNSCGKK